MKKLQEEFIGRASQSGWKFKLLMRDKHKALYMKEDSSGLIYYEPMVIRVQKETVINGSIIQEHEKMPSDAEYGVYAICTSDYERALEYYHEITYEPNIT